MFRASVLTAFGSREPDRVPVDYSANTGIDRRLKEHFGLKPDDGGALLEVLGVDFRAVVVPYAGPHQHEDIPERGSGWMIGVFTGVGLSMKREATGTIVTSR
jgi:hypothetical protein